MSIILVNSGDGDEDFSPIGVSGTEIGTGISPRWETGTGTGWISA